SRRARVFAIRTRQNRFSGCAKLSPYDFLAGTCDTSHVSASRAWRFLLKLAQELAAAAAEAVARLVERALLLCYRSSISHRSCRKPYWLRRNRNQFPSEVCAAEPCLRDTIPNARSPRH